MKKILLAFDGLHFSEGVFEFVKKMNDQQKVLATGIFLPSIDYIELLYSYGGVPAGPVFLSETAESDEQRLNKNIARFEQLCKDNDIACKVHKDFEKHVVTHLKEESRFADLLVLSSSSFYENLGEETQEDYISNVLHKAECPVMLVPENYSLPESIILAYDGSEQSVFAIKQFVYLFPEYHEIQVLLVYFDSGKSGVPERESIDELLGLYFKNLTVFKLKINPRKELEQWLHDHGGSLLVAGAFGRSLFSEMIRKSFITDVIHDHKVPIFVAHK